MGEASLSEVSPARRVYRAFGCLFRKGVGYLDAPHPLCTGVKHRSIEHPRFTSRVLTSMVALAKAWPGPTPSLIVLCGAAVESVKTM